MPESVAVHLTLHELELIRESLKYSRDAKEAYDRYPNPEFKRRQVEEVDALLAKLRAYLRA